MSKDRSVAKSIDAKSKGLLSRRLARAAQLTVAGLLAASMGSVVLAQTNPAPSAPSATERGHRGGFDPQRFQARRDERMRQMLTKVGASEQQITQIQGIWRTAQTDLAALGKERRAARQSIGAALALPTIDRRSLEQLRQQQMQLADRSSQRMTQALADAAEVLDPTQRQKLSELMQQHRGHMRGRAAHEGPGGILGAVEAFEPTT
jgi:periplasmic protein CpxP/Spy